MIKRDLFMSKATYSIIRKEAEKNERSIASQLIIAAREWAESKISTQQGVSSALKGQTPKDEAKTPVTENIQDYFRTLVTNTDRDFPNDVKKTLDLINNSTQLTEKEKNNFKMLLNNSFL